MAKKSKKSFEELAEQFTIQGFFMVSLWASFMFIMGGFIVPEILREIKIIDKIDWKSYVLTYLAMWFFLFLGLCLIPKLRGKK